MSRVDEPDRREHGHELSEKGGAMTVESVMIPTATAHPGMTVRDLFDICGRDHVQALPFVDVDGNITGRVTLSSSLSCVESAEEKAREIICNPIEPYVQGPHRSISSDAPLIKALAMMEKDDTSYIFVVDQGAFRGVITIQGIAEKMSELAVCPPRG